jgi:hypothetical protein
VNKKSILVILSLFVPAELALAKQGDLDITFNAPLGWVSYDDAISGNAVAIQPDRKIVVVGTTKNPLNDDVLVVRYDTEGNLDTSFGANGVITLMPMPAT